jgi:hypothetical protein
MPTGSLRFEYRKLFGLNVLKWLPEATHHAGSDLAASGLFS